MTANGASSSTRRILEKDGNTGRPASLRHHSERRFASGSGHSASAAGCRGPTAREGRDVSSEFDLFRDAERILDLDPEIADRAFQLRVAEQKLNRSQVPRSSYRSASPSSAAPNASRTRPPRPRPCPPKH